MIMFLVVDMPFAYNAIMGSQTPNALFAFPSAYHQKIKFPTPKGIGEVLASYQLAKCCSPASLKEFKAC